MTRTEGRTLIFELLYSLEIQKIAKEEQEEQVEIFLQENEVNEEKTVQYIKEEIQGINANEPEIRKTISSNLKEDWNIDRISKVDLALLKLGIYEIFYSK